MKHNVMNKGILRRFAAMAALVADLHYSYGSDYKCERNGK